MNYHVADIGQGALHVMAAPKPKMLENHIKYLKIQGITKIISLLEVEEASRLQLGDESYYCEQLGIEFENFPIQDHCTTDPEQLHQLALKLLSEIKEGTKLMVHCFAGIGRTGMLSCAIMIENGMTAEEAMSSVTEKRQFKVPETDEQVSFIESYAESYAEK